MRQVTLFILATLVLSVAVYAQNPPASPAAPGAGAPKQAAAHFNKLECFCFTQHTLAPGEKKSWPVVFIVDPKLSKDVSTITLSYTFLEVGGKTPPAPQGGLDRSASAAHVRPDGA